MLADEVVGLPQRRARAQTVGVEVDRVDQLLELRPAGARERLRGVAQPAGEPVDGLAHRLHVAVGGRGGEQLVHAESPFSAKDDRDLR